MTGWRGPKPAETSHFLLLLPVIVLLMVEEKESRKPASGVVCRQLLFSFVGREGEGIQRGKEEKEEGGQRDSL